MTHRKYISLHRPDFSFLIALEVYLHLQLSLIIMCIVLVICHCNEAQNTTEQSLTTNRCARVRTALDRAYRQLRRIFPTQNFVPRDETTFLRSAACSPSVPPPYDWCWEVENEGQIFYPPLPESPTLLGTQDGSRSPSVSIMERRNTL